MKFIAILAFLTSVLSANISKIESLSQIPIPTNFDTIFFFDLDDTIFDSCTMLGSKGWRKYITDAVRRIDTSTNWDDIFYFDLIQKHPFQLVESSTASFVKDLQDKGFVVCGLTSRRRHSCYDISQVDMDVLTTQNLFSVDVDFNLGKLEAVYPDLCQDSEYFHGVFFANTNSKGEYLLHLLENSSTFPKKIIFIDDTQFHAESVDDTLTKLGISHECYEYLATEKKTERFNPLIANIELYYFYESDGKTILSDEEASLIAKNNPEKDANYYLAAILRAAKRELLFSSK